MKKVILDLAGVDKTWQTASEKWLEKAALSDPNLRSQCFAAMDSWKRVLDLRVPSESLGYVQELIEFGRQNGSQVRIATF